VAARSIRLPPDPSLESAARPDGDRHRAAPEIINASPYCAANERGTEKRQQRGNEATEQKRLSHDRETDGRDNSVLHRTFNLLRLLEEITPDSAIPPSGHGVFLTDHAQQIMTWSKKFPASAAELGRADRQSRTGHDIAALFANPKPPSVHR
jgi:hypothetical protein